MIKAVYSGIPIKMALKGVKKLFLLEKSGKFSKKYKQKHLNSLINSNKNGRISKSSFQRGVFTITKVK